jgi:hypothetical protein
MNNIFRYQCLRCKHVWASKQERPRVCPKCKTPYWDTKKESTTTIIDVFSKKWDRLQEEKIRKNKWGRWTYNPANHCLEIVKYIGSSKFPYEVDLDRCNKSSKLLDWIYQVQGKTWISPDDVADLVYAVDDILDGVQSQLCSFGTNKEFNVSKYLSEKVDPLFKNPKALASVRRGLKDAAEGRVSKVNVKNL